MRSMRSGLNLFGSHFRARCDGVGVWGPWTRINYKDRPQELRRLRLKQKKLINLAIEAATVQIAGGNHVAFEHPRDSELWNKPDIKESLQMPQFQEVDFDTRSFGLKAVSDGGLLKKPTKVFFTEPGYAAALHRPCTGDHEHTLTAAGESGTHSP